MIWRFFPVKNWWKNGRGRWWCFRLELKLQNLFGSYLALGTIDKPQKAYNKKWTGLLNIAVQYDIPHRSVIVSKNWRVYRKHSLKESQESAISTTGITWPIYLWCLFNERRSDSSFSTCGNSSTKRPAMIWTFCLFHNQSVHLADQYVWISWKPSLKENASYLLLRIESRVIIHPSLLNGTNLLISL